MTLNVPVVYQSGAGIALPGSQSGCSKATILLNKIFRLYFPDMKTHKITEMVTIKIILELENNFGATANPIIVFCDYGIHGLQSEFEFGLMVVSSCLMQAWLYTADCFFGLSLGLSTQEMIWQISNV